MNLILGAHADELSPVEIDQLKLSHLDQVKYAFWVAKKLKEARDAGESLSLQDVLAMSQPVMSEQAPPKIRRPRKKKDKSAASADSLTPQE